MFRHETAKSVDQFVHDLNEIAVDRGFLIHNEASMEMAKTFARHGAEVPPEFDLHMIQVCKPEKAAKSLGKNPERAVLMPKFIMTFSQDGTTQVRFLNYTPQTIRDLIDDQEFPESLSESYAQIIGMIKAAG